MIVKWGGNDGEGLEEGFHFLLLLQRPMGGEKIGKRARGKLRCQESGGG